MIDINNLGTFSDINAVWAAYPEGGNEGDYLYIGTTKYRWDKYERVWKTAGEVTESPARKLVTNYGDMAVNNDLHVGGTLYYHRLQGYDLGLFGSLQALQTAHPTPKVGQWAFVVHPTIEDKYQIYTCATAGTWTLSVSETTLDTLNYPKELMDAMQQIADGRALTGYRAFNSLSDLPTTDVDPTLGYLVGGHLYVWVETGGDTLDGKYQDCGELRGAKGEKGDKGNTGMSVGDNWEAFSTLEALDGKTIAEKEAMLPDGNALQDAVYLPSSYTTLTAAEMQTVSGYSLGTNSLIQGSGRSYKRLLLRDYSRHIVRKIMITANASYAISLAFIRVTYETTIYYAQGETATRVVAAGTTQIIDVPQNTMYIALNYYPSAVFPSYVGLLVDKIDGGDVKKYVDDKTGDKIEFTKVYNNNDILFTKDEVKGGSVLDYTITLNDLTNGKWYVGYLSLFDGNDAFISAGGKMSNTDTSTSVSGRVAIPSNYAYAKMTSTIDVTLAAKVTDPTIGNFGRYTQFDLSTASQATNALVPAGNYWQVDSAQNGRVWKIILVPTGAEYMRIVNQYNLSTLTLYLASWETPVNNKYPDYADIQAERHILYDGEYKIPNGTNYIVMQTHNTTADVAPLFVGFSDASSDTMLDETMEQMEAFEFSGRQIESVSCPNAATIVMATNDAEATQYDNLLIGYFNVLKVSDNLYYMYYSCCGQNDYPMADDGAQHLAFAYSTDGVTWTRGIPQGITPPITGTNLIFSQYVCNFQVFQVQDADYPYRLLCTYRTANNPDTRLYKSANGVNFELVRVIFPYYNDNQPSCIVRGNVIKVYCRQRSDYTGIVKNDKTMRWVGVYTLDLDGNVISPPTTFFGMNIYQASASILDERREVMFPTYYNFNVDEQTIRCYIVDGLKIKRIPFDTSNLIDPTTDQSYYVAPNIVTIGNKNYIYMTARTTKHNAFNTSNVTRVKRVEVVYETQGTYWKP